MLTGVPDSPNLLMWPRIIKVSDAYSLNDLCAMTEDDMARLLEFYGPNEVPQFEALKALRNNEKS
jgi:precorrin-2 dehydrogenase/sirohydrochlorin ferrochelatase